jgi:DNA-binding NtrC family response regulator
MVDIGGTVLVVDDDLAVGKVLVALLVQAGHEATHVTSGHEALARLEAGPFDVVLTDLQMPGMNGIDLLDETARRWPGLPVIMLTAHGSVATAVEAMKKGAVEYMLKPFDKDELVYVVQKALTPARRRPEGMPAAPQGNAGIVGDSPAMREALALVRKVAGGLSTVLIRGETGTGKELVARALHEGGPRRDAPLITVHCGALPENLLESELFGYEKGAFTGANAKKPGRVELAHQGTLFLDEIGDVSPAVQVKLLRVLQEREFERVGGTQTVKVDVRFVAATHKDLEEMVAKGTFREDLFYRLNVVPIRLPPLRERAGDVERLARHFAQEVGRANGRPGARFDEAALARLGAERWPGNVRQLQNLVERLVVLSDSDAIELTAVERELGRAPLAPTDGSLDARRREAERAGILAAIDRAKGNRSLAARLLCVSRRTLYNKLREHGIA